MRQEERCEEFEPPQWSVIKPVVFSNPISVSDMAKGNPGGVCGHAAPG